MDPALSTVARCALALLLASAACHKAGDRLRFQGILADYRLLPAALIPAASLALIGAEIGLASALLVPATAALAAIAAAVLLAIYSLAIAINLARGRRGIDCGCGGPGRTLHPWLLARNAGLIAVCVVGAFGVGSRALSALDAITVSLGLAALALVWLAGGQLASLPRPVRLHQRRIR